MTKSHVDLRILNLNMSMNALGLMPQNMKIELVLKIY